MKKFHLLTFSCFYLLLANAQTNVSGGIYTNTTWTLANSPYIVTGDVAVSSGFTLTIEPGVVVKFNDGFHLQMNQSNLIAIGTSIAPITFTSNSVTPHPGSWQGIQLLATSLVSTFSHCHFLYAANAIDKYTGSLTIKHCVFRFNNYGVFDDSGGAPFLIDSSSFTNNANYGIYQIIAATIHNCNFSNNNYGMWARDSHIENCVIDSNATGILCTGAGYDSIINCQIMHNGIGFADNDLSTFFGNGGNNVLLNNKIESNTIGLKLWTSDEQITCNTICGNTSFDLSYNGPIGTTASVTNNYWCTTDSATVAAKVYDGYDNANVGVVYFMPVANSPCNTGLGNCSAYFSITPDTVILHTYIAVNMATANTPTTYVWSWGDGIIDTAAYPSHTYAAAGFYTICLTVSDTTGCTNTYCDSFNLQRNNNTIVTVNVVANTSTGISRIATPQFSLSPNPTTTNVTITIPEGLTGNTLTVSDITGRVILQSAVQNSQFAINTSGFRNGIYFITLTTNTGTGATKKLVIQN